MNIEFEIKKSTSYKIGKFLGILYFFVFFPSAIYAVFWILRPYISHLIKKTKFVPEMYITTFLVVIIGIGVLINLLKRKGKFFKGIKDGFNTIPKFISNIVNFILLSIVYFLGIGPVSIISKISGKHYLDLKKSGSTWVDRSKEKKSKEDIYRQF